MWPLIESMELGSDFRSNLAVDPGQDMKWLFLMACIKVDFTGLKAEVCKNCAKFNLVLSYVLLLHSLSDIVSYVALSCNVLGSGQ